MPTSKQPLPPPPGEGETFYDRFGDYINIAPSGNGYVLITIGTPDPNKPDTMIELPAIDVIPLFTAAVKATGKTPQQLREHALEQGLVTQPASRQLARAQRRALAKKARKQ